MRRRRPTPAPAVPALPDTDGATLPILVALGLALLARLAAMGPASNWLWGLDTWRLRPLAQVAPLLALALLAAIPPVGRALGRALGALGHHWERGGLALDALLAAGTGWALFALRDPLRFPGDSALRMGMVEKPLVSPALLAQAFPLDRLVNLDVPRALHARGMAADDALQLVGAVVGALFALAAIRFVRACGARGGALPGGVLVLLGGALPLHFVGYDKLGPLMLGTLLAAAGTVRLARSGTGAVTFTLGLAIAALAHRSALLLAPAAGWVLLRALATSGRGERVRLLAAGVTIAGVFAAVLPRALDIALHFDAVVHLPGGNVEAARMGSGLAGPALRLADALNVTAFLVPLSWAALGAAGTVARLRPAAGEPAPRFGLGPVAAFALAAGAAIVFGVSPGAGWTRDWDVATGAGTLLACASAGVLVAAWRGTAARATLGPAFALGLAVMLGTWLGFLDPATTRTRARELADARPVRPAAIRTQTYNLLANWAYAEDRPADAAAMFDHAIETGGPNPRLLYQAGLAYVGARMPDSARARFRRAVTLDPQLANAWSGLATIALDAGRPEEAAALADTALALQPTLHSARYVRDRVRGAGGAGR